MYRKRVVFDTSVYVSRILQPQSVPALAVKAATNAATILISVQLLKELNDVLRREKFRRFIALEEIDSVLGELRNMAQLIHPTIPITACRDPDDDHILSLAVAGGADVVVTGDQDLLILHPFRGIPILSPRDFLDGQADA